MVTKKKVEQKIEQKQESNKLDFSVIEKKWQEAWEKSRVFEVSEDLKRKKFYVLEMFPYPSGAGIHMGHAFNYTIGDIFARFKRMNGFNVLYPMGYDSLGLPAENAAIKNKTHPEDYTHKSIANFIKQQKTLGLSYDWSRQINTANPEYYKWDQWIFLKMFEKGLVYEKEASVNWCSSCKTIISNEQAQGGKCERCGTKIEIRQMKQLFLRITDYADRLLEGHKKLNWPEKTIAMQKNWIGKSYGTEIKFGINGEYWNVFTTRPDTLFGVTFMVVSAQHPKLDKLVTKEQRKEVDKFLKKLKSVSEKELESLEKEGVFTGSYAINPVTGDKVPVYAGNFVVADYAGGMVMAVPAHDQRDFEFAKKYKIKIKQVIEPLYESTDGFDAFHKTEPKIDKEVVVAIIKNPKNLKYLCLKWKKNSWKTFVSGGIEKDEDVLTAARREIEEETGYTDLKFIKTLPGKVHTRIYHNLKKENREAHMSSIYFELNSDKRKEISKEENELHEILWLTDNDVEKLGIDEDIKLIWAQFKQETAYTGEGYVTNSPGFNGLNNEEAKKKITDWLISKKLGRKVVNYKLKDWSVARQRYWGTPIPLVHCDKCGLVPVPEKDLPVKLPEKVKFGEGNPLLTNKEWLDVKCPKCGGKAHREANTMDTFVNSSWYFLRYCDSHNTKEIFDKKKVKYWMPIDLYIGGAEHACMHLIYCRFYTMFLHDLGLIDFDEPAPRLFHQGMINGYDGQRMSKSKGNGVEPLETMKKYGVDTTRFYLMSEASPDKGFNWNDSGIQGSLRIINKVLTILDNLKFGRDSKELEVKLNNSIKSITEQIENLDYRKSTIELRELFDLIAQQKEISKESFVSAIKLLAPFCPHIAEEIWQKIGMNKSGKDFISLASWPKYDEKKLKLQEDSLSIEEKMIGYVKSITDKFPDKKNVYLYVMPFELGKIKAERISKAIGKMVDIWAVNNKAKFDPNNRASKARPGMPGVYLE